MRVLGVARAELVAEALPDLQHDFAFHFVGLVGLVDPVRDTVPAAVAECHAAGIRVVMITGDYPETARAIGRTVGIDAGDVVTGAEVAAMSDDELRERARTVSIFARMVPEQKLRLVRALGAAGEVVAMQRPPRPRDAPLFTTRMLVLAFLQGASVLAASLALYVIAGSNGDAHARAIAFTSLMSGNLASIVVNRSWRTALFSRRRASNRAATAVVVAVFALLVTIVSVAPLRGLFAFDALAGWELPLALVSGSWPCRGSRS